MPPAPWILDPVASVWLPRSTRAVRIPIRYWAPPEVGTLRPAVFETINSGSGTESKWIRVNPRNLELDGQEAEVEWEYTPWLERASLHVLGIGQHYTYFRKSDRSRVRWPRANISGEGVYGYFDGSTKSRPVHVFLLENDR